MNSYTIGTIGEEIATDYMAARGYRITGSNVRHTRKEVDLIAEKGGVVHMVEVKTRRSNTYGSPASAVTRCKFLAIETASQGIIQSRYTPDTPWQIDIMSITLYPDNSLHSIELIENISCP